ncbi:MAG TPA: hypothetical protein H9734_01395, partial [Candidatus Fusicatenibacter merdavium]|nr:hypothetical protein [Candidatus Fusicatenibacter merdavium]
SISFYLLLTLFTDSIPLFPEKWKGVRNAADGNRPPAGSGARIGVPADEHGHIGRRTGRNMECVLTPTGGQTGAVCSPAFRADDLFIRRQLVSALSPADTPPLSVRL